MKKNQWKYPRLSYSRISEFINDGPFSLIHRKKRDNVSLTKGSVLDDILFSSAAEFQDKYIITRLPLPTASLLTLANRVVSIAVEKDIPWLDIDILEVIKEEKLWTNIKKEEVLKKKFNDTIFFSYVNNSLKAIKTNSKIISWDIYDEANHLAGILLKDDTINFNLTNKEKGIQNLFQHKLEFVYEGFTFLGYIDILRIDHNNKTIKPIDLKTTSSKHTDFISSFFKWNYYIQAGIYTLGIYATLKDLGLSDYKILPFEFIVASFTTRQAMTYVFTDKWFQASVYGFKDGHRRRKGINEALSDIRWHFDNQVFNNSKYISINEKKINIASNFITINDDKYEGE